MLKKIHLLLFAFALGLPAAGYGLVGGPWDNGDYSQLLDNSGIYQATLRFSNGQGFCQFGSNVNFATFRDLSTASAGLGNSTSLNSSNGSYLNRSLIYYKGVTYLGSCYGTSDMVNNVIEGITNGNSDVTTQVTTNTGGIGASGASSSTTVLIANGDRAFTCNTAWSAKITSKKPVLKFSGKGQLTVLNPEANGAVNSTINAILGVISGIASIPFPPGPTTAQIALIDDLADAIDSLTDLSLPPENLQATLDASDHVPLTVFGTRKFFVNTR